MIFAVRSSRFLNGGLCRACFREQRRMASDLPAPPLLLKLRGDLKDAMKNKDTARLAVLRSVLAEVMNAAKTNNPMKTDMQVLGLLRKRAQSAREAVEEFQQNKREDLVDKENAQIAVIEQYAATVKTMDEDEITKILQDTVGNLRTDGANPNIGTVAKELYKPGGPLDGKPVDRARVTMLLKGML